MALFGINLLTYEKAIFKDRPFDLSGRQSAISLKRRADSYDLSSHLKI